MTATEERPTEAKEIGRDRRRKEDQRLITGRTRWTDNITLPGMLHLAMVRSPFAHARITEHRHQRRQGRRPTWSRCSPAPTSPRPRARASTPGRSRPTRSPRRTRRWPSTGSPSPARSSPWSSPAAAAEARDAAELVDVDYDELPAALDLKEAAEADATRGPRAPRPRHQQVGVLAVRLRAGRHRRRRRRGHREGPRRRHRDRAGVPPAAADPGVHGAALGRRRPDRGADHHVVGHPDPAHPAVRARRDDRGPRVEDPGHRPRRRRRLRRQAAADAGGDDRLRGGPPAGQAGEVHRDPLGVADERPPRPRPVAEAHPRRHEGRHGHRPQGRPAGRPRLLRRPRRRRRAGARRVHVQRDLQVPGLPVQLPDGAAPTRPGPTPTAAPAGPRRPTPSSG